MTSCDRVSYMTEGDRSYCLTHQRVYEACEAVADERARIEVVFGLRRGGGTGDNDFQRGYRQGWNDAIAVAHAAIEGA